MKLKVGSETPIEIRQCGAYAIDESNGCPVIWVSSKRAWYEINPAPSYQRIYRSMCEATVLYYKLHDIYAERAHKRSRIGAKQELQDVFFEVGRLFERPCSVDSISML